MILLGMDLKRRKLLHGHVRVETFPGEIILERVGGRKWRNGQLNGGGAIVFMLWAVHSGGVQQGGAGGCMLAERKGRREFAG